VASIENHEQDIYAKCDACHSAHVSTSRYLLREDTPEFSQLAAQGGERTQAELRSPEEVALEAVGKIRDGRSLTEMLRDVYDSIRMGQIQEARVYMKVIMRSDRFTDAEKRGITAALLRMEELPHGNRDESEEPVPQQRQEVLAPREDRTGVEQAQSISAGQAAELYIQSMKCYKAGQLLKARSGFRKVLYSGATPQPVARAIQQYLSEIEDALAR
jgi:hypothetical protein